MTEESKQKDDTIKLDEIPNSDKLKALVFKDVRKSEPYKRLHNTILRLLEIACNNKCSGFAVKIAYCMEDKYELVGKSFFGNKYKKKKIAFYEICHILELECKRNLYIVEESLERLIKDGVTSSEEFFRDLNSEKFIVETLFEDIEKKGYKILFSNGVTLDESIFALKDGFFPKYEKYKNIESNAVQFIMYMK